MNVGVVVVDLGVGLVVGLGLGLGIRLGVSVRRIRRHEGQWR